MFRSVCVSVQAIGSNIIAVCDVKCDDAPRQRDTPTHIRTPPWPLCSRRADVGSRTDKLNTRHELAAIIKL